MKPLPEGDFELDSTTKKDFAITIECSQTLIDILETQTSQSFV